MTRNFAFTTEGSADVLAIWTYLADEASQKTADRVVARIYDECQKLGDVPGMGHYREDLLDRRHRFWRVYSYLICYRWEAKPIEVIAVVHGARDLDAFFAMREG